MSQEDLTPGQRAALVDLARIGAFSAYVPPPDRRPEFQDLVSLGLARSCGPGLGGEGYAPTPAGRRAAKAQAAESPKKVRGFALLSPERRREIASLGGKSVAPQDRSFARDRNLAAQAGRVGGEIRPGPRPKDSPRR